MVKGTAFIPLFLMQQQHFPCCKDTLIWSCLLCKHAVQSHKSTFNLLSHIIWARNIFMKDAYTTQYGRIKHCTMMKYTTKEGLECKEISWLDMCHKFIKTPGDMAILMGKDYYDGQNMCLLGWSR